MNILDFTILIIILFILYIALFKKKISEEQFVPDKFYDSQNDLCDEYEDPSKFVDMILGSKNKPKVNPYFNEIQFNSDYRDTMNAFELLIPSQRKLFNRGDLPIVNEEVPSKTEIKDLISGFIREVNKTIKNHVGNEITLNGWNNNLPEKKFESGWDRQQKALGLPASIYTDPAPKSAIKLIKLLDSHKSETDDEIRFELVLVVQKRNVKDQMVCKVCFVVSKMDWNLDREFFDKKKNTYNTVVKLENIEIIGYFSNNNFGKKSSQEKFYNFDSLTDGRMFSQKDITKELNKKKRLYDEEMANAGK
jgi:hypothetical protein